MSAVHHERRFQEEIADHLEANGWLRSADSSGYDKERALFPEDLLAWLEEFDPSNFHRIVPKGGSEAEKTKGENRILDRVARVLGMPEEQGGGTLNVLKKGFDLPGARRFSMVQMPPADNRNPKLIEMYQRNRLRVVPEVVYSTKKADRIDLVLFCNGLPVATIELKTEFTQSIEDAKAQYKHDRKPAGEPLLTAGRGALVHFAVSTSEVWMTTKLRGSETFFLPFNKGHNNGAGNPPNDDGARTAYLWEEIFERDTWLHILTKFIYTNHERRTDPITGKITDTTQIRFPRYHQWRAVTRLVEAAREEGPGNNYLIQHSAGSGKTDSIAWTAHRLAALHSPDGEKVFDSVFVLADRQVLDKQLRDAVDQLVTATGTFVPITGGSDGSKTAELIDALVGGVPIIGVTLQTFPYALEAMRDPANVAAFEGKHFAVIADEAHSSQSGAAAGAVKELLYLGKGSDPVDLDEPGADQDVLAAMAAHADEDKRLSFFAFTATPKAKTLELFGQENEAGEPVPFDVYSMKQAIEEEFILDVLQNYTSYSLGARISRKADAGPDEEVDVAKGTRAYIDFVELHPTNVSQKVGVILDHYTNTVAEHLGGRAKAMVVTSSRAAAVKYARAFEKAIADRELPLKALVAFSGELPDPDVTPLPGAEVPKVTEASMNPSARGRDLAEVFNQVDHHILVVANKYQTGFDQPLLVAMYVDKQLSGISAVQTLSRLNRMAPNKSDTYVLDFVNDPEVILEAFKQYYEDAYLETGSDPDLVADLMAKCDAQQIYTEAEIERLWTTWTAAGVGVSPNRKTTHGQVSAPLQGAVDRFGNRWAAAVETDDGEELEVLQDFRTTLGQYVKAYAFFSQLLHFGDPRYEKFSVFAGLLARELRNFTVEQPNAGKVDVSDVVLTHYRLEKIREEDLQLSASDTGLVGMTEAGMARLRERERAAKSALIEKVNEYFGDLEAEEVYAVSALEGLMEAELVRDTDLELQARNNTKVDFLSSPTLRAKAEDALWRQEFATAEVQKRFRELSWQELLDLFRAAELYERLRGEAS